MLDLPGAVSAVSGGFDSEGARNLHDDTKTLGTGVVVAGFSRSGGDLRIRVQVKKPVANALLYKYDAVSILPLRF
ncbi:hypothetical protein C1879_04240 [Paraeggerthella hongkongensis]|uniref:hypothetical protein n=1 Tax=Paraeggerthella sp. TaxID=2897350 RepID=UPI000DF7B736|nr:hypothetical protein C1879_04240 [Paraeggerthella hongkongensis]